VRFAIRPRVRPAPGEHRAMVYFTQQPSATASDERIRILFRLGAAVYAYAGNVTRQGRLVDVSRDGNAPSPQFLFDIESGGNAHVRLDGQYAVWPASAYPGRPGTLELADLGKPNFELPPALAAAGRLPSTPVLPGNRRQVPLSIDPTLPAGAYVLDVRGALGDAVIARAVPFTLPAP
jgi:hypothetical protein